MFEKESELIESLSKYSIEIGVISEDTGRKETVSYGITNAELMQIHENGSPIKNIPARPVLDLTIMWTEQHLIKRVLDSIIEGVFEKDWGKVEIERELSRMCIRMENHAREIIYDNDGTLAPNSPQVAKRKKGNHPLFDTGQLARSITCKLRVKN
jgi:hypothetical protein